MRSTWPALVAVVAVGTVIGISIGGLPSSRASESIALPSTTTLVPATAPIDTTPLRTSTTAALPSTVVPTTVLTTTVPATTVPATTPPTTTPPTTASPPSTVAPTTTDTDTTDAGPTTVPGLLDRVAVRLVLANGDGRYNLVGANVDRLLPLGYVTIDQTDVPESQRVARTTIHYRDGFEDEARRLAADLLVPAAVLEPLGDRTVTADDANGDLIAVLGPDAVR